MYDFHKFDPALKDHLFFATAFRCTKGVVVKDKFYSKTVRTKIKS